MQYLDCTFKEQPQDILNVFFGCENEISSFWTGADFNDFNSCLSYFTVYLIKKFNFTSCKVV